MRLTFLLLLIFLSSCKTLGRKKAQDSKLHDYPPTASLNEQEILSKLVSSSEFYALADDQFKLAEEALRRAKLIINSEGIDVDNVSKNSDTSALATCLQNATSSNESDRLSACAKENSVSEKALGLLQRAAGSYLLVGYAYSPPFIVNDATEEIIALNPSVLASAQNLSPDVYTVKNPAMNGKYVIDEFWDNLLKSSCQGNLTPMVHALCEEYVTAFQLHSFAVKYLEASINSTGAAGIQNYTQFTRYYELAEQKLAMLSNYHSKAMIGYSSTIRGIFDNTATESVDMIAVVGDRTSFVAKIEEYYLKYKEAVQTELSYRLAAAQSKSEGIRTLDDAKLKANSLEQQTTQDPVVQAEATYISKERDALTEKLKKVVETSRLQSQNFVINFNSIFGKWSAKTKLLDDSSVNISGIRPNGGTVEIVIPDVVQQGGMLEFTANSQTKYRSNGIYFNNIPDLRTCCSIPKPKIKVSCSACEKAKTSVKKAYAPVEQYAKDKVGKPIDQFMEQRGKDLANLDKSVLQPAEKMIMEKVVSDTMLGLTPIMSLFGGGGQSAPAIPGLPGALGSLESLGSRKSTYPFVLEHVYRQTTDVNGYIISTNTSRNVSSSTGTSMSNSLGLTVGGNFVVTATVSTGVSNGTSTGRSEGASSGASAQIGYYHPRAKAPNFRVGMLLGRFFACKNPAMENYIVPVGSANIIRMDPATACSKMELFINDDLAGAKQQCATGLPCATTESLPVHVSFYQDSESIFNGLMSILNGKEFTEILNTVAYSSDAYGSAWNLFINLAKQKGLTEDPRFRPVIDQFVTQAMNSKEIERISLEMQRIDVDLAKSRLNLASAKSQIDLLKSLMSSNNDLQRINASIQKIQENQAETYRYLSEFYGSRLSYWFGTLRKSVAYHNPDFAMQDFYSDIQVNKKQAESKVDGGANVESAMASFNQVALESALDALKGTAYIEKLLTQTTLGHCFVSLTDLGISANGLVGLQDPRLQKINRVIADKNNVSGSNPSYDPDLVFSVSGGTTSQIDGYYKIHFDTDPAKRLNYSDAAVPDSGALPFRCGSKDDPIGMDKLIGIGLSYSLRDGEIPTNTANAIHVVHDSFMFAVKSTKANDSSVIQRRIYKYLDRSFPSNFWGQSIGLELKPTTPVKLRYYDDVTNACGLASGLKNYETIECMKFVLGQAVDSLSLQDAGPIRSFYNSYLGGSWDVLVPAVGWDEFVKKVESLRVHFFFKKRRSVG